MSYQLHHAGVRFDKKPFLWSNQTTRIDKKNHVSVVRHYFLNIFDFYTKMNSKTFETNSKSFVIDFNEKIMHLWCIIDDYRKFAKLNAFQNRSKFRLSVFQHLRQIWFSGLRKGYFWPSICPFVSPKIILTGYPKNGNSYIIQICYGVQQ